MRAAKLDRATVLAYLAEHGRTSTDDLYTAVGSAMRRASFNAALLHMRAMGYVQNVAGPGVTGVWVADLTALPADDADTSTQEPDEPIHDYPRYCLERVPPPRQHDTRQCTGWRPPAMACARSEVPSKAEHIPPSLVNGVRVPHQSGYIAALDSGHNPPADT